MEKAPLNAISAFVGTAILGIFVVALAESISAGFAGFWGGFPFWVIIIFVLGLAVYNFFEETTGITRSLGFFLQSLGVLYAGLALAFGCYQASGYSAKFKDTTFRLPFADTQHMISSGWLKGIWLGLCLFILFVTVVYLMKMYRNYKTAT